MIYTDPTLVTTVMSLLPDDGTVCFHDYLIHVKDHPLIAGRISEFDPSMGCVHDKRDYYCRCHFGGAAMLAAPI